MSKKSIRLTDIEKWDDPWFRELELSEKAFWLYICDECDIAGVWKVDFDRFFFVTRVSFENKQADLLKSLNSDKVRILVLDSKYWFVKDFYYFQNGTSNQNNVLKSICIKIMQHRFKDVILPYLPDLTWALENTKSKNKPLTSPLQAPSNPLASPLEGGAKGEREEEELEEEEKKGLLGKGLSVDNSIKIWRCPECSVDDKIVEMPEWRRAAHMDNHAREKLRRI